MEDIKSTVIPDASRLLNEISRYLNREGIVAYLVGGLVRDLLLRRETMDIDITVKADALAVAPDLAAHLGGKSIPLDEKNGIVRIITPGPKWQIDLTTLRGDIRQDLEKRDFTIDAMALELGHTTLASPAEDNLFDPFHGREDLQRGLIKAVSDDIFREDPARLLRAVRIGAELGFTISPETEDLMRENTRLVRKIAGERVREELLRLFALKDAGRHLTHLDELGLLTALVPELESSRGVDQPRIHFWDVFDHSLQTVAAVEFLLREAKWEFADKEMRDAVPWSPELEKHFEEPVSHGSTRRSLLKLAALLHDVAKPHTKTVDEDGRARFLGHPQEGAIITAEILERLRFSNKEIQIVELLVKYHMRPTQMSQEGLPTKRAIYRFFRDTGETGIDLLLLTLADHLATRGPDVDKIDWLAHAELVGYILDQHFTKASGVVSPGLIDGHDLINTFGLEPGPKIGALLEAVREAQAAGEVTDRQGALEYIRILLSGSDKSAKNRLKD